VKTRTRLVKVKKLLTTKPHEAARNRLGVWFKTSLRLGVRFLLLEEDFTPRRKGAKKKAQV
jgi:hypothetical protein